MSDLTGNTILEMLATAGITSHWEWTGGPCRAVIAYRDEDASGLCMRITASTTPSPTTT